MIGAEKREGGEESRREAERSKISDVRHRSSSCSVLKLGHGLCPTVSNTRVGVRGSLFFEGRRCTRAWKGRKDGMSCDPLPPCTSCAAVGYIHIGLAIRLVFLSCRRNLQNKCAVCMLLTRGPCHPHLQESNVPLYVLPYRGHQP